MRNKKAFSVGEMMIVLLIISIVLAASLPVITRRTKSPADDGKVWNTAINNSDVYFNTAKNQGIIIGNTKFPTGEYAKIFLSTDTADDTDVSHILFGSKDKDASLAKLRIGLTQIEFGKDATANKTNATALGHKTSVTGDNATALGYNAEASADDATALGYNSQAAEASVSIGASSKSSANSVSIGSDVKATGNYAVAIGNGKKASDSDPATAATGSNSVAVGSRAISAGNYSIALGYNSSTTDTSTSAMAIGPSASALYGYSVAIGPGAFTEKVNQLCIGNTAGEEGTKFIKIGSSGSTTEILGTLNLSADPFIVSDARKKNVIGEYKSGLDDIMKIKTYEFTYKNDLKKEKRVGVLAQELQKIFPNAVKTDEKGYLSIKKEDMFFAMINAIKQLKQENIELKKQIEELSARIDKLEQAK
jgi:hypothetical protein